LAEGEDGGRRWSGVEVGRWTGWMREDGREWSGLMERKKGKEVVRGVGGLVVWYIEVNDGKGR